MEMGAGETAQPLSSLAFLPESLSLVPSTHTGQFTTTWNTSTWGI